MDVMKGLPVGPNSNKNLVNRIFYHRNIIRKFSAVIV